MATLTRKTMVEYGVFTEKDMVYASVPVPPINNHKGGVFDFTSTQIANYGQSQTHPSIVYIAGGFGGHEYWMATTPYPKSTAVFENPCIYYGDADINGNPPRVWTPISGTANGIYTVIDNPIVKVPNSTTVNSDPDLFYDSVNNKLCLISRENTNGFAVYYQESLDGQSWTPRTQFLWKKDTGLLMNFPEFVSPAILKIGTKWRVYNLVGTTGYIDTNDDYLSWQNKISKGIYIMEGTSFEGSGNFTFVGKASFLGKSSIHPWHFDITFDTTTNKYYAIVCAINYDTMKSGGMYLAESTDGLDFKMYSKPVSIAKGFYRPTLFIKDGNLVIYWCTESGASTLPTDYPNGASDIPNDGRAVGYMVKKLTDVITELKKNEVKGWV
jgi:hypothetical protein